jgi:flagellar biosynthesis protein FlhG
VATPDPTSLTDAYALLKTINYTSEDGELPQFYIIVNKIDSTKEGHEIFNKLHSVCVNFLKIDIALLGFIPNDYQLVKAVRSQKAAAISYPKSLFSEAVDSIAESILTKNTTIKQTSGISTFMKRLISIFNA